MILPAAIVNLLQEFEYGQAYVARECLWNLYLGFTLITA